MELQTLFFSQHLPLPFLSHLQTTKQKLTHTHTHSHKMPSYLLQIILVLCIINAQAAAVVAAEALASLAMPNCEDRCGDISIPYPFGIGANCSATKSFTITCTTSFKVPKPFIDIGINLEVLEISILRGTIRVEYPVVRSNYCNKLSNEGLVVNLSSTPFSFSDSSRFTVMGCDGLAFINEQKSAIGGCTSFCNRTSNDRSCNGINCCQTKIPWSLRFINVSLRSIDPTKFHHHCRYAFMVDQEWFSRLSNPFAVQSMENVPVVLDWVKHGGPCESFEENNVSWGANYPRDNSTNNASSLCGLNTRCSTMGLCICESGFFGNPYLSHGCQGALTYLHSAASVPIYHRDIKSTNILLDEKFRAKVADFGTSRSIAIDQTHLTTKVLGTFGYLDPEYFQSSQFTEKSDVYSFGVVLVELITGEKAVSSTREEGRSLVLHFKLAIKKNRLNDILDARVVREGDEEEIKRVANLAKRCLNSKGKKRPTMREVAMELEGTRTSNKGQVQEHHEVEVEDVIELEGPWDTGSTSIGSFASNSISAS
ncbi:hypothetical protein LguiB_001393 [Lonicera macranthoides]